MQFRYTGLYLVTETNKQTCSVKSKLNEREELRAETLVRHERRKERGIVEQMHKLQHAQCRIFL